MSSKTPIKVCLTGAAGQIGYSLIPLIASGRMFGSDQPVILHLLEIPMAKKFLEGVCMEIQDCSYPLLNKVVPCVEANVGFKDIDYAILVGGFPRRQGMLRSDLLKKNSSIFIQQGQAINKFAKKTVKVLVVANPANTNCLICAHNAPSIPKKNFSALTRLDLNRAIGLLSSKLNTSVNSINDVVIWGNHSKTQYPDCLRATFEKNGKKESIADHLDSNFINKEFITTIQNRGAAVIKARGKSSALSAANAISNCFHDWVLGTSKNTSMAVYSDGSYGIQKGIYYSFPVTCENGDYKIIQNINLTDFQKKLLKESENELIEEAKTVNITL